MGKSQAEIIAALTEEEREKLFEGFTEEEFEALQYDAGFWLRPEQKIPDGDWFITALVAGRGFGKMVDISTKIPTPEGWKTVGEIKDGDKVFDEKGSPCTVLQAHPIQYPKKAYRLTFSDGSTVDCGEEHLWTTWTHADRKSYNRRNEYIDADSSVGIPENWPTWTKQTRWGRPTGIGPKVRTTQEIVDTFRHGKRGDLNHSIPVAGPIQYPEKHLPIDPYVFGAWLGDGSKSDGVITSHVDEADWLTEVFSERGYEASKRTRGYHRDGSLKNCYSIRFPALRRDLKQAGILGDKLIPAEYLMGSEQQRRDFLAGLLDTDGFTDPRTNYVEFCAKRKEHADTVMELARSLGQKPRMYTGRATCNGKDHGFKYRVQWRPTENFFYMPRKAAAFVPMNGQASRNMHRMITDFQEIPVIPMRCLSVDSPNRLFLVGEAMIPTHNTLTASQWIRKKALENPGCRIAVGGRTVGDVRRVMVQGESGILAVHAPHERPEYKPSVSTIYWPNGSIAELHSSESPDACRGPQYHYAVGDEFAAWTTNVDSSGATLYSNMIAATRLGSNPQLLLATTPKRTMVMKDLMNRAKDPDEGVIIIRGSTFDNTSLSTTYVKNLVRQYGDSDLAKQELNGEMLEDSEGLVFTQEMIDRALMNNERTQFPLRVIAVDPSVSADPKTSDECGIVAVGSTIERDLTMRRSTVLKDYSLRATPDVWAQQVVDAAKEQRTKFVIVERNQGGDLLRLVINTKDPTLKVFPVVATKGKMKRAEPVVVAMQQGRIKFKEHFPELIDQLVFYDPEDSNYSPDRLDAFVWGMTACLVDPPKGLRPARNRTTSASNRQLPSGYGTGRSRARSSVRR